MSPSPLYDHLLSLTQKHAKPSSLEDILSIRSPTAIHSWGHAHLVRTHPKLAEKQSNAEFTAHLHSTGKYLDAGSSKVHSILVDEYKRESVIHMSYHLKPKGSEVDVEQDLIWLLKFTQDVEDISKVFVEKSVEFIDAAASTEVGRVIIGIHGSLDEEVRGGITLGEDVVARAS